MMKSAMLIGEPALGALYPSDKGHIHSTHMTALSTCINLNYYICLENPYTHTSNVDVINVCPLKINVGILHLDPDAEYPEHVHYAEEIYQVDFAMDQ